MSSYPLATQARPCTIQREPSPRTGEDYFLQARRNVTIPGLDRDVAQSFVDAAENVCTYSKAIRGNGDHTIKLV